MQWAFRKPAFGGKNRANIVLTRKLKPKYLVALLVQEIADSYRVWVKCGLVCLSQGKRYLNTRTKWIEIALLYVYSPSSIIIKFIPLLLDVLLSPNILLSISDDLRLVIAVHNSSIARPSERQTGKNDKLYLNSVIVASTGTGTGTVTVTMWASWSALLFQGQRANAGGNTRIFNCDSAPSSVLFR